MTTRATIATLLLTAAAALGELTIDPGVTQVVAGTASVDIPVAVVGGDAITDLTGAVRVTGADITAVSYAGSVWESAPGGFISFFPTSPPSSSLVDPNLSLLVSGQTVAGAGTLFTFTVDTSSLPAGDYPIALAGTDAGSTTVLSTGDEVASTVLGGTLRIIDKPLLVWRAENFPAEVGNSSLEASVWGDGADPDSDGIANLLEFAFALPPRAAGFTATSATSPGLPVALLVSDGELYRAIRYTRRTNAPCHLVEPGLSTDLANWDHGAGQFVDFGTPTAHPGGLTEMVTKRLTTPVSAAPSEQFLRLRVTVIDP